MISAARAACRLTVKELRDKKDGPPDTTVGGGAFFQEVQLGQYPTSSVAGFQVQTSSQKTGAPVKAKVVGRRSPEEA